jgi:hypothetical protein
MGTSDSYGGSGGSKPLIPRLVYLQATVLLAPSVVRLLHNPCIPTSLISRLSVGHSYFNLSQQIYHLLWLVLLSSCHLRPLSCQFLLLLLVQKAPGTPRW